MQKPVNLYYVLSYNRTNNIQQHFRILHSPSYLAFLKFFSYYYNYGDRSEIFLHMKVNVGRLSVKLQPSVLMVVLSPGNGILG